MRLNKKLNLNKEMAKMRVYNGEDMAITIVTDGNADVVIQPGEYATIETDAAFNSDGFYVQEDGDWYAKENGSTGADLEIYNGR